ncbi:MAG: sugar ABC transporter permease [Faecalicatena sp.]|uniref:carbohydrate ABC transporter permease n=1 Tax=Faecalicatena sp. TaxID=2005360 RepID=UPI002586907D|nr:sugar ABC transporter permease [Faecalicatena sp.]MCI6466592.1 sugar ABC transporter permease [Faecalicatena sp.]MDY5617967.1 sugar ABC transporter permease [Lachnospiraceae bacterium]
MKKTWKAKLLPYLFLTPTFIFLAIFSYYAIGNAIYTSFTDSAFGQTSHWIGLENYIAAFHDEMFLTSFRNQLIITVAAVFTSVFFPLLAAELLFFIKHKRIANIIKTAFVIPMLVPQIVVILIWKFLYNPNFGFNSILKLLHIENLSHNWLNDQGTALLSIVLIGFPFISSMYFLIIHTGLNMIGEELYEAAIVDGATQWDVVRNIHVPNLTPYIKIVVTLSLIQSLSGFGLVAATTNGGPGFATTIPALQMYKVAFGDGKFGRASAMGVILFVVIIILTLLSRKTMKEED